MDPIVFLIVLCIFYSILFFFDRFFKSCLHYPYEAFLRNTGFSVELMRLKWHTTAFNRSILRLGNSCCRLWLIKSFNVGVMAALSLLPIGIILLFIAIFNSTDNTSSTKFLEGSGIFESIKIQILLPGINLPLEEIGYYIITLLIATTVHELGHALAAILEDVPVTGFGFHFYFCLPLAYTEISAEHLNALRWFRKLRILCAGIWHNFLFTGTCYLLFSSLGFVVAPFYNLNKNIVVTEVLAQSPLKTKNDKGLYERNIITHINNCKVIDYDTWLQCLFKTLQSRPGYCVSSDFIRNNDESMEISHHGSDGNFQCCDERNKKLCCFEYIDDFSNDGPVEIPQHVCLDVRRTLEDAYDYCTLRGTCNIGFCLKPLLRNITTILSFKRKTIDHKNLKDVIYMGHPIDVFRTVRISPFVPKHTFVTPEWADAYVLFLKYNIVFNLGLSLISSIPCFGFDGHHIANTIVHTFLITRLTEKRKRDIVSLIVSGIGTLLLVLAVLKVLWLSLIKYLLWT
uniref:Membrane-bound transcription factor site-2 protease n=1 Tax=Glossina brevipalpis TaxID=37001 RepID=A0A1A9WW47_9MUSC